MKNYLVAFITFQGFLLLVFVMGYIGAFDPVCEKLLFKGLANETVIPSHAPAAAGMQYSPRVYIYNELREWPSCSSTCDYYDCTTDALYKSLRARYPHVVTNPDDADLFYIPWSVQGSFMYRGDAKLCKGGETHLKRLDSVVQFLQRSPHFLRHGGRDHFWDILNYNLAAVFIGVSSLIPDKVLLGPLRHIIYGHYIRMTNKPMKPLAPLQDLSFTIRGEWKSTEWSWIRWNRTGGQEMWHKVVLVPIIPKRFVPDCSFKQWLQERPNWFFFRGGLRDCRFHAQRAFFMSLHKKFPKSFKKDDVIEPHYAPTVKQYESELRRHRFCVVIRCDDMETSRFIDAVANNCIPVTLSDGWRLSVAPFVDRLNYDAFTFNIPQRMFAEDPEGALNYISSQPEIVLQQMHGALMEARRALLFAHPESITHKLIMDEAYRHVQRNETGKL
jgi:hypothetical protein